MARQLHGELLPETQFLEQFGRTGILEGGDRHDGRQSEFFPAVLQHGDGGFERITLAAKAGEEGVANVGMGQGVAFRMPQMPSEASSALRTTSQSPNPCRA